MHLNINDWQLEIPTEFQRNLEQLYASKVIYPPQSQIYRGLELTSLANLKVVIFGQDPYHQPGVANGLAFSSDLKIPPSLRNLYKELFNDLGVTRSSGDLSDWATQGVLLLNTSLTVEAGKAGSHAKLGWDQVITQVINQINQRERVVIFVLMGQHAKSLRPLVGVNHLIIETVHPSPLSANRGFFGCKLFSQINQQLTLNHLQTIDF